MRLILIIAMVAVYGCRDRTINTAITNQTSNAGTAETTSIPAQVKDYIKGHLPGWNIVDTADYIKSWWSFYNKTQIPHFITIDLNDDRLIDYALLLKKENKISIAVLFGSTAHGFTHWIANDFNLIYDDELKNLQYGLAIEPPTQIDVMYPEEQSLMLRSNAVTVMEMEERAIVYYWQEGAVKTFYAK